MFSWKAWVCSLPFCWWSTAWRWLFLSLGQPTTKLSRSVRSQVSEERHGKLEGHSFWHHRKNFLYNSVNTAQRLCSSSLQETRKVRGEQKTKQDKPHKSPISSKTFFLSQTYCRVSAKSEFSFVNSTLDKFSLSYRMGTVITYLKTGCWEEVGQGPGILQVTHVPPVLSTGLRWLRHLECPQSQARHPPL